MYNKGNMKEGRVEQGERERSKKRREIRKNARKDGNKGSKSI